jgi:hypothetical protein
MGFEVFTCIFLLHIPTSQSQMYDDCTVIENGIPPFDAFPIFTTSDNKAHLF